MIGIREAARRLGVSDTAVHKAIRAGRVQLAKPNPNNGRPRVAWPDVKEQWERNSDPLKRTHVGSRGSKEREKYAPTPPEAVLPTRLQALGVEPTPEPEGLEDRPSAGLPVSPGRPPKGSAGDTPVGAPSLAQSRAVREAYMARLAKLEFEERSGKLVSVDQVKTEAFKLARSVRDAMLNIPDKLAHVLANESDPARVHLRMTAEIRQALSSLGAPQ